MRDKLNTTAAAAADSTVIDGNICADGAVPERSASATVEAIEAFIDADGTPHRVVTFAR
jgi:hypothetical protein